MSYTCYLKVTVRKVKRKCEVNFNDIFYIAHYILNIFILMYNQYKNYQAILHSFFTWSFLNLAYILPIQHNSAPASHISDVQ